MILYIRTYYLSICTKAYITDRADYFVITASYIRSSLVSCQVVSLLHVQTSALHRSLVCLSLVCLSAGHLSACPDISSPQVTCLPVTCLSAQTSALHRSLVCLSACLPVRLSACHLSVCPPVCLSLVCLSACLPVTCPPVTCLPVQTSAGRPTALTCLPVQTSAGRPTPVAAVCTPGRRWEWTTPSWRDSPATWNLYNTPSITGWRQRGWRQHGLETTDWRQHGLMTTQADDDTGWWQHGPTTTWAGDWPGLTTTRAPLTCGHPHVPQLAAYRMWANFMTGESITTVDIGEVMENRNLHEDVLEKPCPDDKKIDDDETDCDQRVVERLLPEGAGVVEAARQQRRVRVLHLKQPTQSMTQCADVGQAIGLKLALVKVPSYNWVVSIVISKQGFSQGWKIITLFWDFFVLLFQLDIFSKNESKND